MVPAAKERVIHRYNAPSLKCKFIAEAAHGPTTVVGEEICEEKGIQIIPDLILNAGGVTVSYFEWLKNIQHVEQGRLTRRWEEDSTKRLYEIIRETKLTRVEFNELRDKHHLHGANELKIVYSALEDMLTSALDLQFEKALKLQTNIRIASLSSAIDNVGGTFKESGILF